MPINYESQKELTVQTKEQTSLPPSIPTNILEAEQALRKFDTSSAVGPKCSCTRFELLNRLQKLSLGDRWEQARIILEQYPALGHLKVHERYQACERNGAVTAHVPVMNKHLAPTYPERPNPTSTAQLQALGTVTRADSKASASVEIFPRTLANYGNTCFFNSLLQLIASIPPFIAEILDAPLPPDYANNSYCLAFLKLFVPAIASLSSSSSKALEIPLVGNDDWRMSEDDWQDFVYRLAVRHDPNYTPGTFADPGDLLDYFMSIVPGVARMCEIRSKTVTTHSCKCLHQHEGANTVCDNGLTISVDSNDTQPYRGVFSRSHVFFGSMSHRPSLPSGCRRITTSTGHYGSLND